MTRTRNKPKPLNGVEFSPALDCIRGCTAMGGPFSGTGGHAPGCPVGRRWAEQRIAAGRPYPGDLRRAALDAGPGQPTEEAAE